MVTAPVVVFVKPVPVKTTVEPNASPTTKFGACEVTTGPATVIAGVNVVVAAPFFAVTATGPAVASVLDEPPAPTVAENVKVVPVAVGAP